MAHMNPTPVLEVGQDKTMVLNMGPQHPSTHGVLRLLLEIDGETIVRIMPDIGYLHTGIEKTCEAKFYQQVVPMTDRIDYLCPMTNNLAYCLAVEKLLGMEIPEKAQWLRVLCNELTRINSHLVWLGTGAMDLGAMTVFLYCFREREELLKLFEAVSGQRMMTSYFRIGGVALEPPLGWLAQVKKFADTFPSKMDEYEGLLTTNPIFLMRTKGVALSSRAKMLCSWELPARRCAAAASISISAATCRTPATTSSSSKSRYRRKATSMPGTCAALPNFGRAARSCSRHWPACPKVRSKRTRRRSCCRTARR